MKDFKDNGILVSKHVNAFRCYLKTFLKWVLKMKKNKNKSLSLIICYLRNNNVIEEDNSKIESAAMILHK